MVKSPPPAPPRHVLREVPSQGVSGYVADSMSSRNLATALQIQQVSARVQAILKSEAPASSTPAQASGQSVPVTKAQK
jgi:hypothetical protein